MKLLMENWRGYLEEAEAEAEFDSFLDNLFNKIAKLFGAKLEDTSEKVADKVEKEGELDEGLMLAAGLILAVPAIVKLFTGIARVFGHAVEGWTGKDLGIDRVADKIVAYADKTHHLFQKPIGFFVKKVLRIKDEKKAHQATELLFTLLIAFLMVSSGVGAAAAATKGQTGLAGFEGALAAVKGGEVSAYLKTMLKQVAGGK